MACLVWKPEQFEVQSYGAGRHTAPPDHVCGELITYLVIFGLFRNFKC